MAITIEHGECDPANFTRGRPLGYVPEAIVLHSAMGSLIGLEVQCKDPVSSQSTHYGIGDDGSVRQFVDETDTAYHAGVVDRPQWSRLKPNVNPNYYTVGVTFAGVPTRELTAAQRTAAGELIATICERWRIPLDGDHIISHQRLRASKDCPGTAANIDDLIAKAAQVVLPSASTTAITATIHTVTGANLRAGAASSAAPIARTLEAGTEIAIVGHTRGERVAGNDRWYLDGSGNYLWAGATDAPDPGTLTFGTTDGMELGGQTQPVVVDIDRTRLRLPEGQYLRELTSKNLIVLHFTAGQSAKSAFDTWVGTPERVATAYIVDTDGSIYETYDPAYWAPHLGVKGTYKHDRRSIGIEIANVGPLKLRDDGELCWWVKDYTTRYCDASESERFVRTSYRTFDYYAAFPQAQVVAVARLVDHLCERFAIRKGFADPQRRAQCDPAYFEDFIGIATHANFRADKYDVGPAFDWSRLGG